MEVRKQKSEDRESHIWKKSFSPLGALDRSPKKFDVITGSVDGMVDSKIGVLIP